jgi:hypothetical protein
MVGFGPPPSRQARREWWRRQIQRQKVGRLTVAEFEPFEYVRQLLIALSSADVDLRSLLPDVWIAAHPEHFLQYRGDEAEAAARARKRRREKRRAESKSQLSSG